MYIIYGVIAVVGSVAAAAGGGIVCITLRIIESLEDEESQDMYAISEEEESET